MNVNDVLAQLDQKLVGDSRFSGGRILGSMCSTPHPVAAKAFQKYLETNVGDPGLVPAMIELEREVIQTLGTWWGNSNASGRIVTGGTEANLLALWTAKLQSKTSQTEVLLPESAHFSFDKAASMLGLTLKKVPVDDQGRVVVSEMRKALSPKTVALVAIAGSTSLGAVDDLAALARIASDTGIYLHVDASFGGFVLPFLEAAGYPCADFRWKPGISSVAIDPHKMGRGPIPSGAILWKDLELAKKTSISVQYLSGGRTHLNTVVGTRSGASVAAVWAVMKYLGKEGYVEVVKQAMDLSTFLTKALQDVPGAEPVLKTPVLNVVGVRSIKRPAAEIAQVLRQKGWSLSVWNDFFRIVVMPHVTRPMLKEFLADLQEELS